ncbi:hypothetical protein BCR42DRAFT_407918 [Absidia repens]|uniref:Uncharacterized protein n=1 Tax=Absidia repens TaxID=90262 RepID=A0A1X2ISX8_9FUNG|nr:hypothetical protein BCR42DRAFT_407918 [Absidia repens]
MMSVAAVAAVDDDTEWSSAVVAVVVFLVLFQYNFYGSYSWMNLLWRRDPISRC